MRGWTDGDEDEFDARRALLLEDYESWARSSAPSVETGWIDTALDWKFHYRLGHRDAVEVAVGPEGVNGSQRTPP